MGWWWYNCIGITVWNYCVDELWLAPELKPIDRAFRTLLFHLHCVILLTISFQSDLQWFLLQPNFAFLGDEEQRWVLSAEGIASLGGKDDDPIRCLTHPEDILSSRQSIHSRLIYLFATSPCPHSLSCHWSIIDSDRFGSQSLLSTSHQTWRGHRLCNQCKTLVNFFVSFELLRLQLHCHSFR